MTIRRMDHVGIVVEDLAAATAFFVELGLELEGSGSVGGEVVDRIVGLDDVHAEIAMLRVPGGGARLELTRFLSPPARAGEPGAPPNTEGLRHLAFAVDDLDVVLGRLLAAGGELVGQVERYGGSYRLGYVRGPAGVIVELAEPGG